MNGTYYTLLVWDDDGKEWSPEFGDYSAEAVREAMDGMAQELQHWELPYRVIATDGDQASIDAEIEIQNGLNPHHFG